MTVRELIEKAEVLFPDTVGFAVKKAKLRELDGRIYTEFLSFYPGVTAPAEEYDSETELLLPREFSEVYIRYLCLQTDIEGGDTARYINSAALFNSAYLSFITWYNRTHTGKSTRIKI